MEGFIVNDIFINQNYTYNEVVGGHGGNIWTWTDEAKKKQSIRMHNRIVSVETRKKISINNVRKHKHIPCTEENKKLYSKLFSGSGNNMYNTIWIHDPKTKTNKVVKRDILDQMLNNGWQLGKYGSKTVWVHNDKLQKSQSCHKRLLETKLNNGWEYGRKRYSKQ